MVNGTLEIDISEQQCWIDELTERAPSINLDVKVARFDVSDYHVGTQLGIEYKSHNDFLGSIGDRLKTQAHELATNFQRPVILVASTMSRLEAERPPEVIRGFVASLTIRQGVSVLFCGSDNPDLVEDTPVPMILKLAQKATTESNSVYNPLKRGGSKGEFGLGVIASLPSMGAKRARKIIEHYGSPLDALVSVDTWHEVEGIGAKTALRCLEVLTAVPEPSSGEQDWGVPLQEESP